jgi:uncharacterized repeat protein (TIGR03803 family)
MQTRALISRAIVLAAATLIIPSSTLPISAQNSVPASAVQAAKMPQYASRLARPASQAASRPTPARPGSRNAPEQGPIIYDNGPINGYTYAWTINFGFVVSNTFTLNGGYNPIVGISFGAWLTPGDTLESAELSITANPNGGISYFDQTVNFEQPYDCVPQLGYNVCTVTASFNGPSLNNNGTYWVNLQNASVDFGDPVYWDQNSGAGCQSPGCPSQAYDSSVGTIPSESFSLLGQCEPGGPRPVAQAKAVTVPPSQTPNYRVIYNFTGGADGGSPIGGLVIDAAGNLYGTTGGGGPSGGGTAFKLSPNPSGWRFTRLYAFSSTNGGPDNTPVLDADGRLFGTTYGGTQSNGVLFDLSPPGHISPNVFGNWMETLLYSFTGGSDGARPSGSIVLDSSGNIYGTTPMGGANAGGTLYEFTNSGIQILHSFPALPGDGSAPLGVVNGPGGVYGITSNGGTNRSGTFYTTAGGYQVLHNFTSTFSEGNPVSLAADQAGNLYGTSNSSGGCGGGASTVFQLSPPDWIPSTLTYFGEDTAYVATDAMGNIYGTTSYGGQYFQGNVFKLTCCWNYTDLYDFTGPPTNDGTDPVAAPVVDSQGNIFGTTLNGGTHSLGVVWEISP